MASARETIGRVCAGAIAEKMLKTALGIDIVAWVSQVGQIKAPETDGLNLTRAMVDASMIRCPDTDTAKAMEALVLKAKEGFHWRCCLMCLHQCAGRPWRTCI